MVSLREALGAEVIVHFSVAAKQAVTEDVRELAQDVGDDRAVRDLTQGGPEQTTVVGRFSPRSRVREDEAIDVAVDMRSLHFFDPETGTGIHDATNGREGSNMSRNRTAAVAMLVGVTAIALVAASFAGAHHDADARVRGLRLDLVRRDLDRF